MKDKINILDFVEMQAENAARFVKCWNILRTMTDEQLEYLEKQTDAVIEEFGENSVGVHVGPTLQF